MSCVLLRSHLGRSVYLLGVYGYQERVCMVRILWIPLLTETNFVNFRKFGTFTFLVKDQRFCVEIVME